MEMNRYTCMKYLLYILLAKRFFSHMTFSSTDCLANTSRKLGTYLLITVTIGCHRRFPAPSLSCKT